VSEAIPSAPPNVSTAELQNLLQAYLEEHGGGCVVEIVRRPSEYRSSYELDEIDVQLDDGRSLQLIWKETGRTSLSVKAIDAKPEFLLEPSREIEVYRRVLPPHDLGTAACYGSVADCKRDCYGILLERVSGLNLAFVGEIEIWQAAARWLARLHDRFARSTEQAAPTTHLLMHDRQLFAAWIDRAVRFCRLAEIDSRALEVRRLERLGEQYDGVLARLAELPQSLIHGEFFPSNVLVDDRESPPRICPIDWELAGIGPRWLDLAALMAGNWRDDERESMQRAYYEACDSRGRPAIDYQQFLTGVDLCRLHLAVQMLGWSATWRPSPAHANDWLSEAVTLADQLELLC
jgi:hypothetical protein